MTPTEPSGPGATGDRTVVAVVPAHNEATRVAATVRALRSIPEVREVVVIDDGSTDATGAEAERAGARVVRIPRNIGKGPALRRGFQATDAEVVLLADADLEGSATNLRALIAPVLDGRADVAVAAPPPAAQGPSGFGLVERLARWGIARRTGLTMRRPLSGQRALLREVVTAVGGFAAGFGAETGLTVDAVRAGYRVVEVPCEISHARTGRDVAGFVHRARQGIDVLRALVTRRKPS